MNSVTVMREQHLASINDAAITAPRMGPQPIHGISSSYKIVTNNLLERLLVSSNNTGREIENSQMTLLKNLADTENRPYTVLSQFTQAEQLHFEQQQQFFKNVMEVNTKIMFKLRKEIKSHLSEHDRFFCRAKTNKSTGGSAN